MNPSTGLMTLAGVLLGAAMGVFLHWGWVRRGASNRLRLPARWLLNARALVNSEEQKVWTWLRAAFPDHSVMVKVPVMRFSIPSTRDLPENNNQRWHQLLEGVYCTFSVCTLDGKVLGCVDVPGKRGLSRGQREMKEELLLACGIGYTTVRSTSLPSAGAMRTAFLGEALIPEIESQATRRGDSSFHAALDEFTSEKMRASKAQALQELKDKRAADTEPQDTVNNAGFNPDGTGSFMTRDKKDRFAAKWEDSFTMPNDSRPAKLS